MGRIDVILPDELEAQLRVEIAKRYGGKKGDLGRAVEDAVRLWMNKPVIERLRKLALSAALTPDNRKVAIETLAEMGEAALEPLLEISGSPFAPERQMALEKVRHIIAQSKHRQR